MKVKNWYWITPGWHAFSIFYTYRVEKFYCPERNKFLYSIGEYKNSLIKFESEEMLYKFLTV